MMDPRDELDRQEPYPGQIELALRSVFLERAGELDLGSIARLRAIDYQPRVGVAQRIRSSLTLLPRPGRQ